MSGKRKEELYSVILSIIVWGTVWGIFEATAGYLLHLISFNYGWVIWYPFACFFMGGVYRQTKRASSVIYVGLICAGIKMFNLLLPIRIDKVINPAISIVFEALSMALVLLFAYFLFKENRNKPYVKAITVLSMNTLWRIFYILYLVLLVPEWIRNISVISGTGKLITFSVIQNLITGIIIFIGYLFRDSVYKPIKIIEGCLLIKGRKISRKTFFVCKSVLALLLLFVSISLQFILK